MSFEPMTTVRLLKSVPLDNSYSDTLTFDTAADQTSYFLSKTKFTANELTYQREELYVNYPAKYDDVYDLSLIHI